MRTTTMLSSAPMAPHASSSRVTIDCSPERCAEISKCFFLLAYAIGVILWCAHARPQSRNEAFASPLSRSGLGVHTLAPRDGNDLNGVAVFENEGGWYAERGATDARQ